MINGVFLVLKFMVFILRESYEGSLFFMLEWDYFIRVGERIK